MKNNSINKSTIDWVKLEKDVKSKALGFNSIAEIGIAIQYAISSLKDGHTTYTASNGKVFSGFVGQCTPLQIGLVDVPPDKIGYIRIQTFSGNLEVSKGHAQNIQAQIKILDKPTLKGWIVDLRGNLGGNMWPMLVGVGPILGNGVCGAFITSENSVSKWSYANGIAQIDSNKILEIANPYKLINSSIKVAVLTDNATASSGEAIAIAFRNASNTKSFGLRTCGVSTANAAYPLSDGAILNLTVSVMADRTLKKYGSNVLPDVEEPSTTEQIKKAVDWILQ
jgi:C-terminal processing protease CtpA/Prc